MPSGAPRAGGRGVCGAEAARRIDESSQGLLSPPSGRSTWTSCGRPKPLAESVPQRVRASASEAASKRSSEDLQ